MTAVSDLPVVELGAPVLGDAEKRALLDVIDGGWLTMGDRVRRFESAFADLHRVDDAIAVGSATAALQLILEAFDIGSGDEVLVPSMTFVATANVVVHTGATPVFVDIASPTVPHASIAHARSLITDRTRAIIVMAYGGYAVDLPAWRGLADEFGLYLVEDAAHATGLAGHVGTVSDAAAFSFFSNKNMTTAEGGMVILPDERRSARVRLLRAHGMTASTLDRDRGRRVGYDVVECGHNFRMDELRAAIGIVQLERVSGWNARRRELSAHYRDAVARDVPAVRVPFDRAHPTSAHIQPVLLPATADRAAVMAAMRLANVQTSVHYPPVHRFAYYRRTVGDATLPHTEAFHDAELTLPLHPRLTFADVDRVVGSLADAIDRGPSTTEGDTE